MTEIKLCGMTCADDVAFAAELGVRYVGCIFAEGIRLQTAAQAAALFARVGSRSSPRRVGVFGTADVARVGDAAIAVPLDIVQIHGYATPSALAALRASLPPSVEVWAVMRCHAGRLGSDAAAVWGEADALLLDAYVPGRLGGTGETLPWDSLAADVGALRAAMGAEARLVLAGGLTPDNVGSAIAALRPDVVDVSSGVERTPGIKDHTRMRAFVEAVRSADLAMASPTTRTRP